MDLKVSRPIQILLLVLVLAGVGGIASMSMLGKSSPSTNDAAQLSVAQLRARAHKSTAPAATPAKAAHPTKRAAKPAAATTTPAVTPPKKPAPPSNGLPIVLNDALRSHRIVVVSLFDPQSQTDAVSYAEARAGAGDARAGFLGVSVLDDTLAGPLTAALPGGGLLPVPGLLIYRAPGVLIQRIDGFQDRAGVAQLAAAARTASPFVPPAPAAPVAAAVVPAAAPVSTP